MLFTSVLGGTLPPKMSVKDARSTSPWSTEEGPRREETEEAGRREEKEEEAWRGCRERQKSYKYSFFHIKFDKYIIRL